MTRKEPSMSIDINPETEHLVREEIRSGHFSSALIRFKSNTPGPKLCTVKYGKLLDLEEKIVMEWL